MFLRSKRIRFCAFRVLEKLEPEILRHNALNYDDAENMTLSPKYSLIRLSAGLINDPEDIVYAAKKLVEINHFV